MPKYRIERDSLGELRVPADALYGAQTMRAINNFQISGLAMPSEFIRAVCRIKRAAASANLSLGLIEPHIAEAIISACDLLLEMDDLREHFPVDVFQTGSGTSTNMNANEVIARLASDKHAMSDMDVNANDHVNMSQSSNDTIPSAIHVAAACELKTRLIPAVEGLRAHILARSTALQQTTKSGRTHLMDAMPITLGQELGGWAQQLASGEERLQACLPRLCRLAQGGTAVGTGINAHAEFAFEFAAALSRSTAIEFAPAENFFEAIATQDTAVEASGALKTLAVSLMKIANDLRWMNSGPLAGLGEIELPALQPGSSIMPGKVNPVIPEAVAMVCAQVIGNDAAITIGGQSGNFQLNVMLPMIAYNLLQSIDLLSNACDALGRLVIQDFLVKNEAIEAPLSKNPILVTALNPEIGYMRAAEIAKAAYKEGRPIREVAAEMTDLSESRLAELLDPASLTQGGLG